MVRNCPHEWKFFIHVRINDIVMRIETIWRERRNRTGDEVVRKRTHFGPVSVGNNWVPNVLGAEGLTRGIIRGHVP